MDFNILQDIREIFHGLGERRPRIDTVTAIQLVLLKQMTLLIFQSYQIACQHNNAKITIKHVLNTLQNHKSTIIRILTYFLLKENIQKLTSLSQTVEADNKEKLNARKNNSIDNDYVENMLNIDSNETDLDPATFLSSFNFKSKLYKTNKKKSMFYQISTAIMELKLDLNITKEDVNTTIETRQIRVNELSILISNACYESFQLCRRKNFQNKVGDVLLFQIHKALPPDVDYGKEVKELFLFLAKETIACLYDRICENRKLNVDNNEPDSTNNTKKKKRVYTLVDEITAVTRATWNPTLGDIRMPFEENNTFFTNQLIFD